MRLLRWVLAGALLGASVAFVTELLRPRRALAGSSGYHPPAPSTDHRVVLPSGG